MSQSLVSMEGAIVTAKCSSLDNLWNPLPQEMVKANNIAKFKKEMDKFIDDISINDY